MKKLLILIVTAFFSAGAFAGEVGDSLSFGGHAPSFTKNYRRKKHFGGFNTGNRFLRGSRAVL